MESTEFSFDTLSITFTIVVGAIFLTLIIVFIYDIVQKKDAILRNYPLIGHFRFILQKLGEFFRQYFFAMDREEMPFNRAERGWVKRVAYGKGTTIAFGSTKNISATGTIIFANSPFPTLDEEEVISKPVIIGGGFCRHPYTSHSIFNISGMSYGALSKPAVRALSRGAGLAKCWINTGEGGLSPYHLEGGADIVFQIGTAKYGVRDENGKLDDKRLSEIADNEQVKMFEIKLSQGAKPGKGGILPASKVNEEIARIRGIECGKASHSPNRHKDIRTTDELLEIIYRIRTITGKPVGIKFVVGSFEWIDELCTKIIQYGNEYAPDFITIDSCDAGTGAAPMSLMDNVGLPIRESLPIVINKLQQYNLRMRIKIIASGKLITPVGVAWAIATGADFVVSGRGFMFAIGCIQSLKCHKNTCPAGITTHNKRLQKGLNPKEKATKVANYVLNMTDSLETIAHSCGVKEPRSLDRTHVRIVQSSGRSVTMAELYKSSS